MYKLSIQIVLTLCLSISGIQAFAGSSVCDGIGNDKNCSLESYSVNGHAVWIPGLTGISSDYHFVNGSGKFDQLLNGKAKLTGLIANENDPSKQWKVTLYLSNKSDWNTWSANGGSYKDEQNIVVDEYQFWDYYIIDTTKTSIFIGKGSLTGSNLKISHNPTNFLYGFQIGEKANSKNANYGMACWFLYKGKVNGQAVNGHGDFNMNSSCSPGASISEADTLTCLNSTQTLYGSSNESNVTYYWTGPGGFTSNTDSAHVCKAGTYYLTVTSSSGCISREKRKVIGVFTKPKVKGIVTSPTCYGDSDGTVDLTVTGGIPPYTYAWSNGATTQNASGLSKGKYYVTVTGGNGCSRVMSFNVKDYPIQVRYKLFTVACHGDSTGSISTKIVRATPPYTYAWSNGSTNDSLLGVPAGIYTVTVTDADGCTQSAQMKLKEKKPLSMKFKVTQPTCEEPNGFVDVIISQAQLAKIDSVQWSNGATVLEPTNLGPGVHNLTIYYNGGCQMSESFTLNSLGCCNVTDAGEIGNEQENCGGFDPQAITSLALPSGGIGTIEYVWLQRQPGQAFSQIAGANGPTYDPGFISTTMEYRRCARRSGCTAFIGESNWVVMTVLDSATVAVTATNGDCSNGNLGSAAASGGTTYAWSTGAITATINGLAAGTYTVTATNADGCQATAEVTVEVEGCCNVTDAGEIANEQENCGGFDPQAITSIALPTGGIGTIEYVWLQREPGQAFSQIAGANGPTYDPGYISTTMEYRRCSRRNGCTSYIGESNWVVMTVLDSATVSVTATNGDCSNGNLGSATASGGLTYAWSTGATTATIYGLAAGTYTVTATNADGCTATAEAIVHVEDCCNVTDAGEIGNEQENCGGFDPLAITSIALPTGGLGTIEYVWLEREPGQAFSVIAGAYGPTYDPGYISTTMEYRRCSRRNGCTSYIGESNWVVMTVLDSATVAVTATNGDCSNGNLGSATASGASSYAWSTGATAATINGLAAGTYTVTATNADGCEATAEVTVEVEGCCNVTDAGEIGNEQENCGGFDPLPITSIALPTGGLGTIEYVWLEREPGQAFSVIAGANGPTYDPGYISTTMEYRRCSRRNGCTSYIGESNWVVMTVLDSATVSVTTTNGDCSNGNLGSATASGGITYAWSTGATSATINGLAAGTYTVTATNADGCQATAEVTVEVEGCCNVTDAGEIGNEQENCGGFDPQAITSLALPSGGIGTIEYVWLEREPGQAFSVIAGANGPTYDPGYISTTMEYRRCSRRNGCTSYIGESNWVVMTVLDPATVAVTATNGDCSNGNLGSATASGASSYEWSTGATTATINGLAAGTYTVTATNTDGCTATAEATVSVEGCCNVTDAGEIGNEQANCGGFDPDPITSIALPTGGLGTIEYVWLEREPGQAFSVIAGANGPTYDPGYISTTMEYRRCSRRNGCTSYIGESNWVVMTVLDPATLAVAATNGDCSNGNLGSATASGASSYAWSTGATTTTINGLAAGTYTVTATNADGCEATAEVTVEVEGCCNVTDAGEIGNEQENCGGFDPDPITSIALPTGGLGTIEYVWLEREPGQAFSVIAGANGPTYDPGYISTTMEYRRCSRRNGCTSYIGESNWVVMTVDNNCCGEILAVKIYDQSTDQEVSAIGAITNGMTISPNDLPSAYYITVETSSSIESVKIYVNGSSQSTENYVPYTWPNGGENNNNWNGGAGTHTVKAKAYTENNCSSAICDQVELSFTILGCDNVTDAGEIGNAQTNCGGFDPDPITSISLPSGGSGALEYVWLKKIPGQSYSVIPGANGPTYDPGYISQTTKYRRCSRREFCSQYPGESNWITMTVSACINPPSEPTCDPGSFSWENNIDATNLSGSYGIPQADVRFKDGGTTQYLIPGPYPSAFNSAVTVSIDEAISWDAYLCRASTGNQPNEQWKVVFKKNGSVVASSSYTGDLATGVTEAEWIGGLGSNIVLPNGADQILLVHYEDNTYGAGSSSSANSVVPVSICISYTNGCDNVTDAGEIGNAQTSCNGFDPAPITSVSLPSGGSGALEYVWLERLPGQPYSVISGANGPTYDPGFITETTEYRRCSRREYCTAYVGESNWITMTVLSGDMEVSGTVTSGVCAEDEGTIEVSVTSGGTAPFTFVWSNMVSGDSISGAAGEYIVTTTDANGCTSEDTFTIEAVDPIVLSSTITNPVCAGGDGIIELSIASGGTAPFTYTWSNMMFGDSIGGAAGEYDVTVTDANGCTVEETFEIEDAEPIVLSSTITNPVCAGGDGIIEISVASGGTAPFTYTWSNMMFGDSIVGAAGEYDVTVTDANGCTVEETFEIEDAEPIVLSSSITNPVCAGGDGIIEISVASGGTAPFTYTWSNMMFGDSIVGAAGEYDVTVTDANGCTVEETFEIEDPEPIVVSGVSVDPLCFGEEGLIAVNVSSGGTAPFTYTWSNMQYGDTITGSEGEYDVTVTDANGCTAEETFEIGESPEQLIVEADTTTPLWYGAANGSITTTVTGGTPGYSYLWSTGDTVSGSNTVMAGTYTLTVTDANGCTASIVVIVDEGPISNSKWSGSNSEAETSSELSVAFYPNPVNAGQYLTLDINGNELNSSVHISLMDMRGNLIMVEEHQATVQDKVYLNLHSGLSTGTYLVKVRMGEMVQHHRLIIH